MDCVMTEAELAAFLDREFGQVRGEFAVEYLTEDGICMRLNVQDHHLRPGGTVSGPAMFSLADVGFYLAVLARIGPKALSVTTNASIDFMRKPAARTDILCQARILKLGRVLAVGDCLLWSEGQDAPVARANLTYSIPPKS